MTPSLKTYLLVFFVSGIIFSLIDFGFTYMTENTPFILIRFLINMVLFGILGTVVYYITVILPKRKTSPK